jgi:hypothetical protein
LHELNCWFRGARLGRCSERAPVAGGFLEARCRAVVAAWQKGFGIEVNDSMFAPIGELPQLSLQAA